MKMHRVWISLALILLPAVAHAGDAPAVEHRLEELESGLADLRGEVRALRRLVEDLAALQKSGESAAGAEPLARIDSAVRDLETGQAELAEAVQATAADVELLSTAEGRRTQVTVYGTFNVTDPRGEDSVFDAEAFELVLSGQPAGRLGFFAEIEFERAATVGGSRGGEILVEQAYATYSFSTAANLRAGALLMPFGNFNIDHFAPNRDVISKPLVSYVVAPSDWTDNGLGLQGNAIVSTNWSFDYETYLVAGLDADVTALGTRAARQSFGTDNNNNKAIVGRFAFDRAGTLQVGLSGYSGKYDDQNRLSLRGWALDGSFRHRRVRLVGELNRFDAEQPAGPDAKLEGYYGRVVLDVTPRWLRRGWHGRAFPSASFALVAQYDEVRLEGPLDGRYTANSERRTTFGFNYRPTHHWILKLNYEDSEATTVPLQKGDFRGYLASVGFQF